MSTLILNGSPKGNSSSCNSKIFAEEFVRNMKSPCEIKCIAKSDTKELAEYAQNFDVIIFILPLYIHAMPGVTMKFLEKLKPAASEGKSLGFIIQAGFIETSQERFVEAYFRNLAKKLNYNYLGTVSKGEAAATYMYPKMFKKVLKLLNDLGAAYEGTGAFDNDLVVKLGTPYNITKSQLRTLKVVQMVGLDKFFWHKVMKSNNALDKRLDRPFL